DWKTLRDTCVELLKRSKNLRLAVTLTLASLKLEGLPGFRDGLALIKAILENWDQLYPRLDPEDNNDPTERVNIIASMANPLGTFGDPNRFLERLRQAPLTDSPRLGRFSLADITGIPAPPAGETGQAAPRPGSAQIDAAFRDTGAEQL